MAVEPTATDIRLEGLSKRFGSTAAVERLDLEVRRGSFFALLGPSGCGKTTTLRMIGGFEDPTEGRVCLGGADVTNLPPYRRDVNTVFQSYALFPHLSVERNVAFGLERRGLRGDEVRSRVGEMLALTELGSLARRRPAELSGGQQQRVALARALVNRPRALLLDEPLGALDLRLRRQLQLQLKRIQREVGITFVHVTHDQEEAMTLADEIAVMNGGRIEQRGSAAELYERPATEFVANFLGTCNLINGRLTGTRNGLADFETSVGARLRVPSERCPADGPVLAGVRPEKLTIVPAGAEVPDGANVIAGQVAVSSFLGAAIQYQVRTATGQEITVVAQNRNGSGPDAVAVGQDVLMAWEPRHTIVVAPTAAASAAVGEKEETDG